MDDFGTWMGEISHVSKAFTSKAAIVSALKADGDSSAAGLESMTDARLAGVRWRCPAAQTARAQSAVLTAQTQDLLEEGDEMGS